ncbi:MAG: hypothetical protein ACF8QF_08490 [Phycisphaerales bacterium]
MTTTPNLPHPVTFYLTAEERRALLKKLRRHDADRTRALLAALKIERKGAA